MKFCLELETEICERKADMSYFAASIIEVPEGYSVRYNIHSSYTLLRFITDSEMQDLLESIFSSRPDLKKKQIAYMMR